MAFEATVTYVPNGDLSQSFLGRAEAVRNKKVDLIL